MVSWLRANGKILFRGAALLLAGAAAGFGLGLFFAVPAGPAAGKRPDPGTGYRLCLPCSGGGPCKLIAAGGAGAGEMGLPDLR